MVATRSDVKKIGIQLFPEQLGSIAINVCNNVTEYDVKMPYGRGRQKRATAFS